MVLGTMMACFILTAPVLAAPNYQEGQWEITTIMDIPGMPKEFNKPHKYTYCMTKENAVPQPKEQGPQKCDVKQRIEGSTVHWTMTCKDGTVSTGQITYTKNSFKGSQSMTTRQGGQNITMKSEMSGKYLGPCK
jgi:hypothetical protein